ncbi:MAG: histidinol dehydrogenase [Deltaproteobacteria bacterium]|jgi:histidinol dehydrogenase|nr:histidinol dehydrogenase [Deltaproteobacteria bacterium]
MLTVETLKELTPERREAIIARAKGSIADCEAGTKEILARLKEDPEKELLREYGPLREGLRIEDLTVSDDEIDSAFEETEQGLIDALGDAASNIERFHEEQLERAAWFTEIAPGLVCGRVTRPINSVAAYIPGGRAIYPSTALMNLIPAKVAGVKDIFAMSPPGPGLRIRPEIVVAATLAGAEIIYKLGGAWAIGALAYGVLDFPKVGKIVGPGSSWVTAAKMAVFGETGIDLPAGPSEGFIIADQDQDPKIVALDFLAQLEHDPDAAAIIVSTSRNVAENALDWAETLIPELDRAEIVRSSINNAAILVAESVEDAVEFANRYAPEHLQLMVADPMSYLEQIENAGSVFLGRYSPIPAGDYATGTNHVLPTGGSAAFFSGLSTDSFLKKISFQTLSKEALEDIAPTVVTLAEAEGLECHARTVKARLEG